MQKNAHLLIWPAVCIVLIDQMTKWAILSKLQIHAMAPVLPGFFNLVHVRNRGMAFGLLNRVNAQISFVVLVLASLTAIVLLLFWFSRLRKADRWISVGLSFILGGAVGNLIDRVRYGEVIDFLDFYAGPYHWPAFNVADSAITIGTFCIAISLIFTRTPAR